MKLLALGSWLLALGSWLSLSWICAGPAQAQWTIDFTVDEQAAAQAIGAERVPHMLKAISRAKTTIERALTASTGAVVVTLVWGTPTSATAIAEASGQTFYSASTVSARDKLINKAEADGEPAAEILLYESLPTTTIPFLYDTGTVRSATGVIIPRALNQHLSFAPISGGSDGEITCRPPSSTLKWQFWPGELKAGHEMFETAVIHETFHLLGFTSNAAFSTLPSTLTSWDLFRVAESAVPVAAGSFATINRELRPTVEASWITQFATTSGSYKASRGDRAGGDGFQASHWRSVTRLSPMNVIGVMDPAATTGIIYGGLNKDFYSRADVDALDVMGWSVDPGTAMSFVGSTTTVTLVAPNPDAIIPTDSAITFQWQSGAAIDGWLLFIYQGTQAVDDMPFKVYDELATTSQVVPAGELPPGEYTWYVVADIGAGYRNSANRHFTVGCPADLNGDGVVDFGDYLEFLTLYDTLDPRADFNHDGVVDFGDYLEFLNHYESGC